MRITPCVWELDGRTFPALMFEHNVAYNPAVVMPRLMRDYAVLSHVPAILTLIDFQGKVLYQNASSLEYMGDLLSGKYDNQLTEGLLQVLYSCDLNSLEQMLDNVLRGQEWQGVVQVPYSMWRHLGHQQDPDTVIDYVEFTATSFRHVLPGQESQVSVGSGADSRHSNVGFLLNKQATAVGPSSDLVNLHRRSSTSRKNAAEASSFSFGQESRQVSMSAAVAEVGGPNLQQRKFVALLQGAGGLSSSHLQGPSSSQRQVQMPSQVQASMGSYGGSSTGSYPPGVEPEEEEEEEEEIDEDLESYHEIHAIPLLDPVLDKQVIMLVQTDVTPRVELENKLADLTDAQLSMLEELFPRHIIEYMLAREPSRGNRNLRGLANMHDKVMVLFCDVVGLHIHV
ncbi:hypothetical protein CEUSTIGMA_g8462.t1 [Chlamydomonas eustigma]|uniref:PAS domain-containing protein n=1 Tax=Chlamydomonas eustigma TaxID=1157962 RepID=A0A250XD64_9CHLO|nr:hypothetical protein CEUSTIGMA_g8462.t1 [Chlamydomonas eustigma]|eukprot:GAX81027.1 hypothetical protein CEUSTIGMA_g8462.t1 [Chlamydomonas eustigma]